MAENRAHGLAEFRRAIGELKEEERRLGKTAHFGGVNPDDLTEEDRDMYRRLSDGTLVLEMDAFREYQTRVIRDGNASRGHFTGYLGNKLAVQAWRLEEKCIFPAASHE